MPIINYNEEEEEKRALQEEQAKAAEAEPAPAPTASEGIIDASKVNVNAPKISAAQQYDLKVDSDNAMRTNKAEEETSYRVVGADNRRKKQHAPSVRDVRASQKEKADELITDPYASLRQKEKNPYTSISVDYNSVKNPEQAAGFMANLYDDSSKLEFAREYSKRNKYDFDAFIDYAETLYSGKLFDTPQSDGVKSRMAMKSLNDINLTDPDGSTVDFTNMTYAQISRVLKSTASDSKRNEAIDVLQQMSKIPGNPLYGYSFNKSDYGFVGTAELPADKYKEFVKNNFDGKFYGSSGHDEDNIAAFMNAAKKISDSKYGESDYARSQLYAALQEAYMEQTGYQAPEWDEVKKALEETSEEIKAGDSDSESIWDKIKSLWTPNEAGREVLDEIYGKSKNSEPANDRVEAETEKGMPVSSLDSDLGVAKVGKSTASLGVGPFEEKKLAQGQGNPAANAAIAGESPKDVVSIASGNGDDPEKYGPALPEGFDRNAAKKNVETGEQENLELYQKLQAYNSGQYKLTDEDAKLLGMDDPEVRNINNILTYGVKAIPENEQDWAEQEFFYDNLYLPKQYGSSVGSVISGLKTGNYDRDFSAQTQVALGNIVAAIDDTLADPNFSVPAGENPYEYVVNNYRDENGNLIIRNQLDGIIQSMSDYHVAANAKAAEAEKDLQQTIDEAQKAIQDGTATPGQYFLVSELDDDTDMSFMDLNSYFFESMAGGNPDRSWKTFYDPLASASAFGSDSQLWKSDAPYAKEYNYAISKDATGPASEYASMLSYESQEILRQIGNYAVQNAEPFADTAKKFGIESPEQVASLAYDRLCQQGASILANPDMVNQINEAYNSDVKIGILSSIGFGALSGSTGWLADTADAPVLMIQNATYKADRERNIRDFSSRYGYDAAFAYATCVESDIDDRLEKGEISNTTAENILGMLKSSDNVFDVVYNFKPNILEKFHTGFTESLRQVKDNADKVASYLTGAESQAFKYSAMIANSSLGMATSTLVTAATGGSGLAGAAVGFGLSDYTGRFNDYYYGRHMSRGSASMMAYIGAAKTALINSGGAQNSFDLWFGSQNMQAVVNEFVRNPSWLSAMHAAKPFLSTLHREGLEEVEEDIADIPINIVNDIILETEKGTPLSDSLVLGAAEKRISQSLSLDYAKQLGESYVGGIIGSFIPTVAGYAKAMHTARGVVNFENMDGGKYQSMRQAAEFVEGKREWNQKNLTDWLSTFESDMADPVFRQRLDSSGSAMRSARTMVQAMMLGNDVEARKSVMQAIDNAELARTDLDAAVEASNNATNAWAESREEMLGGNYDPQMSKILVERYNTMMKANQDLSEADSTNRKARRTAENAARDYALTLQTMGEQLSSQQTADALVWIKNVRDRAVAMVEGQKQNLQQQLQERQRIQAEAEKEATAAENRIRQEQERERVRKETNERRQEEIRRRREASDEHWNEIENSSVPDASTSTGSSEFGDMDVSELGVEAFDLIEDIETTERNAYEAFDSSLEENADTRAEIDSQRDEVIEEHNRNLYKRLDSIVNELVGRLHDTFDKVNQLRELNGGEVDEAVRNAEEEAEEIYDVLLELGIDNTNEMLDFIDSLNEEETSETAPEEENEPEIESIPDIEPEPVEEETVPVEAETEEESSEPMNYSEMSDSELMDRLIELNDLSMTDTTDDSLINDLLEIQQELQRRLEASSETEQSVEESAEQTEQTEETVEEKQDVELPAQTRLNNALLQSESLTVREQQIKPIMKDLRAKRIFINSQQKAEIEYRSGVKLYQFARENNLKLTSNRRNSDVRLDDEFMDEIYDANRGVFEYDYGHPEEALVYLANENKRLNAERRKINSELADAAEQAKNEAEEAEDAKRIDGMSLDERQKAHEDRQRQFDEANARYAEESENNGKLYNDLGSNTWYLSENEANKIRSRYGTLPNFTRQTGVKVTEKLYNSKGEKKENVTPIKEIKLRIGKFMDAAENRSKYNAEGERLRSEGRLIDAEGKRLAADMAASDVAKTQARIDSRNELGERLGTPVNVEQAESSVETVDNSPEETGPVIDAFKNGGKKKDNRVPESIPQTPQQRSRTDGRKIQSVVTAVRKAMKNIGEAGTIGQSRFDGGEGVAGYHQNQARQIQVRPEYANSLEVSFHELGHAVQERLGLNSSPDMLRTWLNSAISLGYDTSNPTIVDHEAFAEFFWRYCADRDAGVMYAGNDFVVQFEDGLIRRGLMKSITPAIESIRAFNAASVDEKLKATIVDSDKSKNKDMTGFEKLISLEAKYVDDTAAGKLMDQLYRDITGNKKVPLELSVATAARLQKTSQDHAATCLTGDFIVNGRGDIVRDPNTSQPLLSLRGELIAAGLNGKDSDAWIRYVTLQHALDRSTSRRFVLRHDPVTNQDTYRMTRATPTLDPTSFSIDSMQAEIERTAREHPEFEAASQGLHRWWNNMMKEYMVKPGFMNEETRQILERMYPHYVPMNREGKEGSRKFAIRSIVGSTENIVNPMDSIVNAVDSMINQEAANHTKVVAQNLYDEMVRNVGWGTDGPGAAFYMREIMNPSADSRRSSFEEIASKAENEGADPIKAVIDAAIVGEPGFAGANQSNNNIIQVVQPNGYKRTFEVTEPELFRLLSNMPAENANGIARKLGKLTRTMSLLTTGSNPYFALRNAMRDFQTSVNYGSWASNYATGMWKWAKSFAEVMRGSSEDWQSFVAQGGAADTRFKAGDTKSNDEYRKALFAGSRGLRGIETASIKNRVSDMASKAWSVVTLERINEVVEQTSRFAEYKYGKHDLTTTEGRNEAFIASRHVTVDFGRSGYSQLASDMRKLIPFFNASLQGIYRNVNQLSAEERASGRVPVRLAKNAINAAVASAICSALIKRYCDDDTQEEFYYLSNNLKAGHMYIPNFAPDVLGDSKMIRIPIEQSPLTAMIHGAVTDAAWGIGPDDEYAITIAAIGEQIVDNLNPVNSTIISPVVDVMRNKNWYGSHIVPTYLDSYDPTQQYAEETAQPFIDMSNMLSRISSVMPGPRIEISPMKLQYLAEQYTGFLGQVVIPSMPSMERGNDIRQNAINSVISKARKTLTSDPLTSNDIVSRVYNNYSFLDTVIKTAKAGRELTMLRPGLTPYQIEEMLTDAESLKQSLSRTKTLLTQSYNQIDEENHKEGLTDRQKYENTHGIREEMVYESLLSNEEYAAFEAKWIKGGGLLERLFAPYGRLDEE